MTPKKPTPTGLDEANKLAAELLKTRETLKYLLPRRSVAGATVEEIILEARAAVLEEAIRAYIRKELFPQRVNP